MVLSKALRSIRRPQAFRGPRAPGALLLAGVLVLATGCDSITSRVSGSEATAIVVGQLGELPGTAASGAESADEAMTVVLGDVTLSGSFRPLAEATVDAEGRFRIRGVPAGRTNLIVSARTGSGAELGRAVLLEETRGGEEHELHPIDARSTLHARTWAHIQSSGSSSAPWMGPAELALFVDFDPELAAGLSVSQAVIAAIAEGALSAEAALTATLGAQGMEFGAEARNAAVATAAIERDRARAGGAPAASTRQNFVTAALAEWIEAGVDPEAAAIATAAAATAIERSLASANASAHFAVTRAALILNTEARAAVVAQHPATTLGLRASTLSMLGELRTGIGASTTIQQLRASVSDAHAGAEAQVVAAATTSLPDLPGDLLVALEAGLREGMAQSRLWTRFANATTPSALAGAAADARGQVHEHTEAILEMLPANARAGVSTEATAALLIALGAGPHI